MYEDQMNNNYNGERNGQNPYEGQFGGQTGSQAGQNAGWQSMGQQAGQNPYQRADQSMGQQAGQNPYQQAGQSMGRQAGQNPYQQAGAYSYQQADQSGNRQVDAGEAKRESRRAKKELKKMKRRERRGIGAGGAVAIALTCSLVGGLVGAAGTLAGSRLLSPRQSGSADETVVFEGERPVTAIQVANVDTSRVMTAAEVYAQNVNSTVGITTSVTTNFWGYQTTSPASGSGFVLTEDGYIVTNYHVVENSDAGSIKVTTYDGTVYEARLVGYDESNDVAVLKVDAKGLSPVVLGDSETANVGDSVVAIGNPLGELTFSLVSGVVSALDRSVTFSTGTTMSLIQVDCAINAGNSGGALFNMYGEVIGITNAKYSNNGDSTSASIENIGFAIPISDVKDAIESIIEKGYISKPYVGVQVRNVSSEAQAYGLPTGAAIVEVVEDGPAEKAGLKANDIVTKIGDQEITSAQDLVKAVRAAKKDDELVFTVYRQGQEMEIKVTVGETQESALANEEEQNQSGQGQSGQGQNDQGQSGQGQDPNGRQDQESLEDFFRSFPWGFGF